MRLFYESKKDPRYVQLNIKEDAEQCTLTCVKERETMGLRERAQTISDAPGAGNTGWPLGKGKEGLEYMTWRDISLSFELCIINLLLMK